MQEVVGQPAQQHPQRPAIAEIGRRDRQKADHQRTPRNVGLGLADPGGRQFRQGPGGHVGMGLRVVAIGPEPESAPDQTEGPIHEEGAAPAEPADQDGDHRRRRGVAQTGAGMGEALGEAALHIGQPGLDRARGGGEARPLSDADHQTAAIEEPDAVGEAGQDRRRRPDQPAGQQGAARAEFVGDRSAEELDDQIGNGEGREDLAELRVGEREGRLDDIAGGGEIHPVDIGDEIHQAEEGENPRRHAHFRRHSGPPRGRFIVTRRGCFPPDSPSPPGRHPAYAARRPRPAPFRRRPGCPSGSDR